MPELQTARLKLMALSVQHLQLYLTFPDQLEQILGITLSRDILTDTVQRAIRMKLSKMAHANPKDHAWYTYWLVVVMAQRHGAALAGFKGLPDDRGEVEIGYGLDPAFQGQGFTTEAVRALIAWAFETPACRAIIADPKKSNRASMRVLAKAGMQPYAETTEEICWRIDNPSINSSNFSAQ